MNEQFKNRLLTSAEIHATRMNYKFSDLAERELKTFIENGVDRMNLN